MSAIKYATQRGKDVPYGGEDTVMSGDAHLLKALLHLLLYMGATGKDEGVVGKMKSLLVNNITTPTDWSGRREHIGG